MSNTLPVVVLFVEGKDVDVLRAFAARCGLHCRMLHRREQNLYLLEVTGADRELEAEASELVGCRAWSFELIDS